MIAKNMLDRQVAHKTDQVLESIFEDERKKEYVLMPLTMKRTLLDALFAPQRNYLDNIMLELQTAQALTGNGHAFNYKGVLYGNAAARVKEKKIPHMLNPELHFKMDVYLKEQSRVNKERLYAVTNYFTQVFARATTKHELEVLIPTTLLPMINNYEFFYHKDLSYPDQLMFESDKALAEFIEENKQNVLYIKQIMTENLLYPS